MSTQHDNIFKINEAGQVNGKYYLKLVKLSQQ